VTEAAQISKLTASHAAPTGTAPTLDFFLAKQDSGKAPEVSVPQSTPFDEHADVPAIVVAPQIARSTIAAGTPWLGYALAALGHALLLAGLLIFLGSSGAQQQTSDDTIEVEVIMEAPGAPGDRSEQEQPPTEPQPVADPEPQPPQPQELAIDEQPTPPVETVLQETQPDLQSEQEPEPQQITATIEPTIAEPPPNEKAELPPKTEAETAVFITPAKPAPAKPERPRVLKETPKPKQKPPERPVRRPPAEARPNGGGGANGRQAVAGQNAMSLDAFRAAVIARISRNKPSSNIAALAQGVVVVTFGVSSDGAAQDTRISQSSGNAALDNAALQTIRRASPFPPPPPGAPRSFSVPIRFNMR
jgi:protein TonB